MHTSMVLIPAGEMPPDVGDVVDVQRPLITTIVDEVRVAMSVQPWRATTPQHAEQVRLPGPDVVRAVALIGVVVMNFHGYLILRGDVRGDGRDRPVLRSVDRTTGDAVRRHVRARCRRRSDAAHPQRRSATEPPCRRSAGRSSGAGSCSTSAGWCSTRSGRGRSCRSTGRCSWSPPRCSRCARRGCWPSASAAALAAAGLHWWQVQSSLDGRRHELVLRTVVERARSC